MSRIGNSDGLSIIARYTSVVAIASTAGTLPKNVSEDDLRSDQVTIEQRDDQRVEGFRDEKREMESDPTNESSLTDH